MGRKNKGFNTPFANIDRRVELTPPKSEKSPHPAQTKDNANETAGRDESEVFKLAVGDITPVDRRTNRVEPIKREQSEVPDDDTLVVAELEALVRGDVPFRFEQIGDIVWGAAPGVNNTIVDALKSGHYSFRLYIDLHGHTREEARSELLPFVAKARRDGERCILIVTGRGKRSPGGVSVLKEALPRWLTRAPLSNHVLGFCTALQVDGGPGAFYVLLRRAGSQTR